MKNKFGEMLSKRNIPPFQLDHPRVWRTYLGGARLDRLHGPQGNMGEDGHFPEEWCMSVVTARNAGRERFPEEGLSHLAQDPNITLKELLDSDPVAYLGMAHAAKYGSHPGVLVKLIDSAERLTIQVHPDRETAQRLFGSPFGKTECWYILGGQTSKGEKPCVYLGFREGVTREHWQKLFEKQDIPEMLNCLHRFEVEPGDIILIEGGLPHAIGAGCFLVELQEPTDYTIRVERTTPSGLPVDNELCHQGLGFNQMFACFHYGGKDRTSTQKQCFLSHQTSVWDRRGTCKQLVRYQDTPLFAMNELCIREEMKIQSGKFCGFYVLNGNGVLECGSHSIPLQAPGQYFVPASANELILRAAPSSNLHVLQFFGPQD